MRLRTRPPLLTYLLAVHFELHFKRYSLPISL